MKWVFFVSGLQEKLRLGDIKDFHPYSDSYLGDSEAQEGIFPPNMAVYILVLTSRLLGWTGGLLCGLAPH